MPRRDAEETLVMRGITKSYPTADGEHPVLKGLSLTVHKGEMAALMGPSGSGKSTLMNILGILDRQTSGDYILQGVNVAELSEAERAEARNRFIGFVFQAFHLLPRLTLQENVELPLMYGRVPAGVRRQRALELLDRVGLGDRGRSRPGQLSGGQKQRVAVARALAMDPDLLLADEPTGNLDTATSHEIMSLFHELHRDGATILIVTHEPDIAGQTERTIMLRDGIIENDGLHAVPGGT